jgi:hypothetical protein
MQPAEDSMKRYNGFASRPRKRYLVVVVITLAPLIWSFAEHEPTTDTVADSALVARPHPAAPDHAMLMASDVERALLAPQRALPESLTHATL